MLLGRGPTVWCSDHREWYPIRSISRPLARGGGAPPQVRASCALRHGAPISYGRPHKHVGVAGDPCCFRIPPYFETAQPEVLAAAQTCHRPCLFYSWRRATRPRRRRTGSWPHCGSFCSMASARVLTTPTDHRGEKPKKRAAGGTARKLSSPQAHLAGHHLPIHVWRGELAARPGFPKAEGGYGGSGCPHPLPLSRRERGEGGASRQLCEGFVLPVRTVDLRISKTWRSVGR